MNAEDLLGSEAWLKDLADACKKEPNTSTPKYKPFPDEHHTHCMVRQKCLSGD